MLAAGLWGKSYNLALSLLYFAMVLKRKTLSKLATSMKVAKAHPKEEVEEEEDTETQIVAVEESKEMSEKDLVANRAKELKSVAAGDLKELLLSHGLTTGTKEVMIKALLKHEAKARATANEQKAKIRGVVVQKKQELESLSTSEMGKLCESVGIKGVRTKEERIQRLLLQWQESGGVDKALSQIAEDERKKELQAMDVGKLQKLCTKMGVDPYVKEIMVERVSKKENDEGCYSRPKLLQEEEAPKADKQGDMVEALLASEAQRKKDKELRDQQEEALEKKRKELKSLSIDDLKKRLAKKKIEANGKKDDMVEALFVAVVQEDAANARKVELKSKSQQELKELLSRQGLETGSKEQMIATLLAHEAKCREDLKVFEAKVEEVAAQKEEELDKKTNAALKDLCASKGLPVGGDKEERIERIVEEQKKEGEFDKVVARELRNKRKEEIIGMDKQAVVQLCSKIDVDPMVKDIMVERIMMQESEGESAIAMTDVEPAAKKARKK